MGTGYLEAKQAIREMLRSHAVLTVEDLLNAKPQFSWAQLFLAIDLLSREDTITLHQQGLSYELRSIKKLCDVDPELYGESAVNHR